MYLPSRSVGGDSFDHRWLDEDHLLVYLLDVSGHGLAAALLSASIHNTLRSGSIPTATLLDPAATLAVLNETFPAETQDDQFSTIWYAIYQPSTRLLRYASAGHPPALPLNRHGRTVTATALRTPAEPIGMFAATNYTAGSYSMPPGGQLLIYSDGAYEFKTGAPTEGPMSHRRFAEFCTTVAGAPDWSLDLLVDRLKALTPDGQFDDDCALILATFA